MSQSRDTPPPLPSWALETLCDPLTHGSLTWNGDHLTSATGGYAVKGAIPVFEDSPASYQSRAAQWAAVDERNGSIRAMENRSTVFDTAGPRLAGQIVVDTCAGGVVVGCYLAARYGCRVIAVERSLKALDEYGDRFMEYYRVSDQQVVRVCADALRLPLKSMSVAAVVGSSWVHHFEDKVAVLKEALRVMRPGGLLIAHNEGVSGLLAGATSDEDRYISPRGYEAAMTDAGFARVEVRGWSRFYGVARWLRGSVDVSGLRPEA